MAIVYSFDKQTGKGQNHENKTKQDGKTVKVKCVMQPAKTETYPITYIPPEPKAPESRRDESEANYLCIGRTAEGNLFIGEGKNINTAEYKEQNNLMGSMFFTDEERESLINHLAKQIYYNCSHKTPIAVVNNFAVTFEEGSVLFKYLDDPEESQGEEGEPL